MILGENITSTITGEVHNIRVKSTHQIERQTSEDVHLQVWVKIDNQVDWQVWEGAMGEVRRQLYFKRTQDYSGAIII